MALKTFTEVIHKSLCVGPMNEIERRLRSEIRDFLSHSISRYCYKTQTWENHDVLVQFVQDLIKDLPADSGKNLAQEMLDEAERQIK